MGAARTEAAGRSRERKRGAEARRAGGLGREVAATEEAKAAAQQNWRTTRGVQLQQDVQC